MQGRKVVQKGQLYLKSINLNRYNEWRVELNLLNDQPYLQLDRSMRQTVFKNKSDQSGFIRDQIHKVKETRFQRINQKQPQLFMDRDRLMIKQINDRKQDSVYLYIYNYNHKDSLILPFYDSDVFIIRKFSFTQDEREYILACARCQDRLKLDKKILVMIYFDDDRLIYLSSDLHIVSVKYDSILKNRNSKSLNAQIKKQDFSQHIGNLHRDEQEYQHFILRSKQLNYIPEYYHKMIIDDKYYVLKFLNKYIFIDQTDLSFQGCIEFMNIEKIQVPEERCDIMRFEHGDFVIYSSKANQRIQLADFDIFSIINREMNPHKFLVQVDLLSYNLSFYDHGYQLVFSYYFNGCPHFKQFIQISKEDKFPLIRFDQQEVDCSYSFNFFDRAVDDLSQKKIIIYLNLLVNYYCNPYFNFLIDRNLIKLLEAEFNLVEYFRSEIAWLKIKTQNDSLSSQDNIKFYSVFEDLKFIELKRNIDRLLSTEKQMKQNASIKKNKQVAAFTYILNIPLTMRTKQFIRLLNQQPYEEIFELEAIQAILDYKWSTYCSKFFLWQIGILLVFIFTFLIDIYYFVIHRDQRELEQQLPLKIVGWAFILFCIYQESVSFKTLGWQYFNDAYNKIDLLFIMTYLLTSILDIQNAIPEGVVILYSVLLFEVFIKLIGVLRQFKGFNFLVSMLQSVFQDLGYFILLYSLVLILYGLIFTLIEIQVPSDQEDIPYYNGISYFGYFIMSFRTSFGDFQVDNFGQLNSSIIIFAWMVWISAALILNVILLNFIIAVISSSYEKVLQNKVRNQYKLIAQLVLERENYLDLDKEDVKDKYLPRYLIVKLRDESEQGQGADEWLGFTKDVKREIQKIVESQKSVRVSEQERLQKIESNVSTIQEEIKRLSKQQDKFSLQQDNFSKQQEKILNLLEKSNQT